MSSPASRVVAGALVLLGSSAVAPVCAAPEAAARALDPTLAHELRLGAPPGFATSARLDARSSGAATSQLPRAPRVLWRAHVSGSIDWPPVVDADGAVFVAGLSGVAQFSRSGVLAWQAQPSAPPVAAPALVSSGLRVVLTSRGEVLGYSRAGNVRARTELPISSLRAAAPPVPLAGGGLVVAAGGEIVLLDAELAIVSHARVPDVVRRVVTSGRTFYITTELGDVFGWPPPAQAQKLGSFAGRTSEGAMLRDRDHLTAIVDRARIVDFDLRTRTSHTRVTSNVALRAPLTLAAPGETRCITAENLVLGHDASGRETFRVAFEPANPELRGPLANPEAAPLIADPNKWLAYALAGTGAGVITPTGELRAAAASSCADPIAVVPAGPRRAVVACRSGQLIALGDQ